MVYKKRKVPKPTEDDFGDDLYEDLDMNYDDDEFNSVDKSKNNLNSNPEDDFDDLNIDSDTDDYNYDIGENMDDFSGGGPNPLERHGDLLKDLTNFDPYLKKKMYDWMGYRWDEKTGNYIVDEEIEPLLNYKGAKRLISILSTYARGNNILTHLDEKAYKELISDVIDSLCFSIGPDMEEYGITSNSKFLLLLNDIEGAVKLVLQGAGGGKYSAFLGTTIQRNESVSQNNGPQNDGPQMKQGFWGKTKTMLMGR